MTESRMVLALGIAAVLMELGALIVLLVPEARTPSGGSIWSWYWPLANGLYFLGLIAAGATILWALQRLVETRGGDVPGDRAVSLTALGGSVLAIVVNRLIEYR